MKAPSKSNHKDIKKLRSNYFEKNYGVQRNDNNQFVDNKDNQIYNYFNNNYNNTIYNINMFNEHFNEDKKNMDLNKN